MQRALEAGVQQIIDARRSRTKLIGLPEAGRPGSIAEAYAMQRLASDQWGDSIAGWKVGATAKSVQELFGISTPFYGPVFRETVSGSPVKLPADAFQQAMVEAEFGFILGKTLAPRRRRYSRDEILDAIEAVVPALEIVVTRFAKLPPVLQIIADFGANAGAILGTRHTGWRNVDFASHNVALRVNGSLRQHGTGALALGGP